MALTLTVPAGTFHLSGIPIRVNITGASAPAGSSGYMVLLKITSVDGLLVGGPFIDAKTPVSGAASFDVSGYVDQPLEKLFEWPLAGGVNPYSAQTLDINFTAGERYIDSDGDLQETWGEASATHFVIKGGVSFNELGRMYDDSSSFYAEFVTATKFLTRQPSTQIVHPFQPVKLWLLAPANGSHALKIKGYYDNGTSYTYSSTNTYFKDILHEINCMPYHADAVNLAPVKAGAKMTHYEVWIDGLTSKFTFTVDTNYQRFENCSFLFAANSLGGIDVIWLSGEVEEGFNTETVKASKPWPATGTKKDRTTVVSSRVGSRTWNISTGYKPAAEIRAMADILLSRQVWLVTGAGTYNGGTIYPVTIANSKSLLGNTMNDLHELTFEFEEGHENPYL